MVKSMCRFFSCVLRRWCLLWSVHSVDKALLVIALTHSVLQRKICLFQSFLTSYFASQSPRMKRTSFLGVTSRKSCRSSQKRRLQLLQHYWLGHRFGLLWYWMVYLCNEQRSILLLLRLHPRTAFQIFVDYDGYPISSKGFLPSVVDIMITWVKFYHSNLF